MSRDEKISEMYDRIADIVCTVTDERRIHSGRVADLEREIKRKDATIMNMGNWIGSQACKIEYLEAENNRLNPKEAELKKLFGMLNVLSNHLDTADRQLESRAA